MWRRRPAAALHQRLQQRPRLALHPATGGSTTDSGGVSTSDPRRRVEQPPSTRRADSGCPAHEMRSSASVMSLFERDDARRGVRPPHDRRDLPPERFFDRVAHADLCRRPAHAVHRCPEALHPLPRGDEAGIAKHVQQPAMTEAQQRAGGLGHRTVVVDGDVVEAAGARRAIDTTVGMPAPRSGRNAADGSTEGIRIRHRHCARSARDAAELERGLGATAPAAARTLRRRQSSTASSAANRRVVRGARPTTRERCPAGYARRRSARTERGDRACTRALRAALTCALVQDVRHGAERPRPAARRVIVGGPGRRHGPGPRRAVLGGASGSGRRGAGMPSPPWVSSN